MGLTKISQITKQSGTYCEFLEGRVVWEPFCRIGCFQEVLPWEKRLSRFILFYLILLFHFQHARMCWSCWNNKCFPWLWGVLPWWLVLREDTSKRQRCTVRSMTTHACMPLDAVIYHVAASAAYMNDDLCSSWPSSCHGLALSSMHVIKEVILLCFILRCWFFFADIWIIRVFSAPLCSSPRSRIFWKYCLKVWSGPIFGQPDHNQTFYIELFRQSDQNQLGPILVPTW